MRLKQSDFDNLPMAELSERLKEIAANIKAFYALMPPLTKKAPSVLTKAIRSLAKEGHIILGAMANRRRWRLK
jgi:hypothetical protein